MGKGEGWDSKWGRMGLQKGRMEKDGDEGAAIVVLREKSNHDKIINRLCYNI